MTSREIVLIPAMRPEHLGEVQAAKAVMAAIETATGRDIGTKAGQHETIQITAAILAALD